MADVNALYQGQYLRASNLGGREHTVVIVQAESEMVGQGEKAQQKIVLHLGKPNGKPLKQKLPLNKTNAWLLASIFGPQTGNWIGRSILLKPEKALMQGAYVDCIRTYVPADGLSPPAPAAAPKPTPVAVPAAAVPGSDDPFGAGDDELDDDELV